MVKNFKTSDAHSVLIGAKCLFLFSYFAEFCVRIMGDESFKLKVENYESFLLVELHTLQKEGSLCDLTLSGKDGIVKVHEMVLVAASSYFKQR